MVLTHRPVTAEDAEAVAALMSRIAADHPTGFELVRVRGARAARPTTRASSSRAAGTATTWSPTRRSCRGRRTTAASTSCSSATSTRPDWARASAPRCSAARSTRPGRCTPSRRPRDAPAFQTRALAGRDDQAHLLPSTASAVDRHNFLMFSALAALPEPVLPDDLVLGTFDPATAEELRDAHNEAFRDYPNGTAVDEETWPASWSPRRTPATTSRSCCATRRADGRVAAYVFMHEYALAPSGEQGREAYVAYVGTLPAHRGRGPGHPPARPHPARLPGSRVRHLEPRRRHPEPDGRAGHLRACGLRRALPPGQLRARGGAGRVDQVRPLAGALPGVQGRLVVQPLLPLRRASARRHGPARVAAARRGEPRPRPAW